MNYSISIIERLHECKSISCIFNLVKEGVRKVLGLSRGGIILALQRLPPKIFAYHVRGSNLIVINEEILSKIYNVLRQEDVNAYLFYILLHEYLHALGYINEREVRKMTILVCRTLLGEKHLATLMALYGPLNVIPELWKLFKREFCIHSCSGSIRIIKDFYDENVTYIV